MSIYIGNNEMTSIYIGNSEISSIYVGSSIVYSGGTAPVDTTNYLRFTAQQDNSTVALTKNGSPSAITLEYSRNKKTWNTWDLSAVTLNSGDTIYLRGNNNGFSTSTSNYYKFVMSGSIAGDGSVMTLLDKTDTLRNVPQYGFYGLFNSCTGLTKAPELPATTLDLNSYAIMFSGCTNLVTAPPTLPATTISNHTYANMFDGCSSLVTAPYEICATTVGQYSCSGMFRYCTSLTTSPIILTKAVGSYTFNAMFRFCSNLNTITAYIDTTSTGSLTNWVDGVAATGTFYNNGRLSYPSGVSGIPTGWTEIKPDTTNYLRFTAQQDGSSVKLTKVGSNAPTVSLEYSLDKITWSNWDRSAITLNSGDTLYLRGDNTTFGVDNSNYNKFEITGYAGASGSIMTLLDKTDTSRSFSTTYTFVNLFRSCSGLTTAPELPATGLTKTCYQQTFIWCTSLTTPPELPATTLAESCYQGLFRGCTSLTTAPVLPATTTLKGCYLAMFYDCSGLTTAPELPATTLATFSYQEMFCNCRNLTSVTSYASSIYATNCLNNWLNNVAASGTFYNYGGATYPSGASGIPSGWTEITS